MRSGNAKDGQNVFCTLGLLKRSTDGAGFATSILIIPVFALSDNAVANCNQSEFYTELYMTVSKYCVFNL